MSCYARGTATPLKVQCSPENGTLLTPDPKFFTRSHCRFFPESNGIALEEVHFAFNTHWFWKRVLA